MSRRPAEGRRVGFDWGPAGLAAALRTAGDRAVVVVVDVLSFSTAVVVACEAGVPVRPVPPAGAPGALAGGALAGARGAGVSLSPRSMSRLATGTRVVLPSPNGGALSSAAAAAGAVVVAGSIRNASAAAEAVHRRLETDAERTAVVL